MSSSESLQASGRQEVNLTWKERYAHGARMAQKAKVARDIVMARHQEDSGMRQPKKTPRLERSSNAQRVRDTILLEEKDEFSHQATSPDCEAYNGCATRIDGGYHSPWCSGDHHEPVCLSDEDHKRKLRHTGYKVLRGQTRNVCLCAGVVWNSDGLERRSDVEDA